MKGLKIFSFIIICLFIINIITLFIIDKAPKNYYEIDKIYYMEVEDKNNPFIKENDRNLYIYILDKKDNYVKYVYIDNPNSINNINKFSELYYTKDIDFLYPYYKKYEIK
mgnify:CR=1 FL=1